MDFGFEGDTSRCSRTALDADVGAARMGVVIGVGSAFLEAAAS